MSLSSLERFAPMLYRIFSSGTAVLMLGVISWMSMSVELRAPRRTYLALSVIVALFGRGKPAIGSGEGQWLRK
jgi:hypothetical protein